MSHFVFECNSDTYLDCMTHQVFASNTSWPMQVTEGDYLFLHHYETGVLLGLWKARSNGGRLLVPKLWRGRFPFQVLIAPAIPKAQDVPRDVLTKLGMNPSGGRFEGLLDPTIGESLVESLLGNGS
jgi:hypothetical protein